MVKAIAPSVSHTGQVGGTDRVYGAGFFDKLSDGTHEVTLADLVTAAGPGNRVFGAATLYIRTTGSDTTGDGTSANPFATLAGAVSNYANAYPNLRFTRLTLNFGVGTFEISSALYTGFTADYILVTGQGANTILTANASITFQSLYCKYYGFQNFTFSPIGGTYNMTFSSNVYANINNVHYDSTRSSGSGNRQFIVASYGGSVIVQGQLSIKTDSAFIGLFSAQYGGLMRLNTTALDFTGSAPTSGQNSRWLYALAGSIFVTTAITFTLPSGVTYNVQVSSTGILGGNSTANVLQCIGLGGGTLNKDAWSTVYGVS